MEAEFTMTLANRKLDPGIETVFLMADDEFSHVSSSLIKQITRWPVMKNWPASCRAKSWRSSRSWQLILSGARLNPTFNRRFQHHHRKRKNANRRQSGFELLEQGLRPPIDWLPKLAVRSIASGSTESATSAFRFAISDRQNFVKCRRFVTAQPLPLLL